MTHRNTVESESFGNDYFYGCEGCGVGLVLIYKNVSAEYRQ